LGVVSNRRRSTTKKADATLKFNGRAGFANNAAYSKRRIVSIILKNLKISPFSNAPILSTAPI